MPEYRIIAKLDPSGVTAGKAKVEQDLRGLDATVSKTATGTKALASRQTELMRTMSSTSTTTKAATESTKNLDAALDRVLGAVDAEANGLRKMNGLLADAKRLHDTGAISAQQYAKVQQMVATGSQGVTRSLGQQRAGYTQLGFQVQDITQTLALGINPMVVLAQQGGQTASALSLAFGERGAIGRAATFMAGPFGSVILAATSLLGIFALKALSAGSAIDEARAKLEEDARSTAIAVKAKEAFSRTLEGLTVAAKENEKALEDLKNGNRTAAEQAAINAAGTVLRTMAVREETLALIDQTRAMMELNKQRAFQGGGAQQMDMASGTFLRSAAQLDELEKKAAGIDAKLVKDRATYAELLSFRSVELGKAASTQEGRINTLYDQRIERKRAELVLQKASSAEIQRQTRLLEEQRAAALKAAGEADRKAPSDGVARFRSREQAIGIAGRELQSSGLRVDGNKQFGVTTGHANDAEHNRTAIDVNVGRGVTEANVPDLRKRFEELARSYQKRGYNAIFNQQYYPAFGNGPSGPARGHKDHLHLSAPATIVGKETLASTAAQESRDFKSEQTVAEQKGDFVQGIVDKSAAKGLPDNRVARLDADIEGSLAEYKRRFNEAPSPAERDKIVGALTAADAREQAENFRKAYQYPLEDMQLALGQTGIERAIYNRILDETAKKGAPLSDIEKGMIENSVRMTDVYGRQQAILEGIKQPLEDYKQTIAALNGLLASGAINQEQFNARVGELGANARDAIRDVPGVDPNSGMSYGDIAATEDENARYAAELARFQSQQAQLLAIGVNYDALREAAHRRHIANLNNIDLARKSVAVQAAQSTAESLASIAEMAAGKQSAVYKAMFIAAKAFAIADSIIKIQQGIANALALPFPANLGAVAAVAAQAASIVANIQSVALNLADGGLIRGPGGPRDDAVPVNASNGEYMVNARAVSRPGNLALLEAINNGAVSSRARRPGNDNGRTREAAGGDSYSLSFGDVVVNAGNATKDDGEAIGRDVRKALNDLVDQRVATLARPGGKLTRTSQSAMA